MQPVNVALPMLVALLTLAVGYRYYGRRVAKWLGVDDAHPTPAVARADGIDFVAAPPVVLFGHHFASIAAAGPIIGPTLALAYGYVPTWSWILFGVVFVGATHDMTALFLSVRNQGASIAEVTRKILGTPGYLIFLIFALILSILVCAAFLDMVALALTSTYPLSALHLPPDQTLLATATKNGVLHGVVGGVASTSVIFMTLVAPLMGWAIYRRQMPLWSAILLSSLLGLISVAIGLYLPLDMDPRWWTGIVAAYCLFAGFIPIWLLLQPRDFINVQFLYLGMVAMVLGVLACGFNGVAIDAPAFAPANSAATAAMGTLWPILFITIACGSISGAHALIAAGTTAKQVAQERHILPIGYGGMLGEALLGICVTLVILAGLGADTYQQLVWPLDEHGHVGRGNAPLAFAAALGGTLHRGFGLPPVYGTLFGILLLEGFLLTTVDTIIRLSRYLFDELWQVLWRGRAPLLFQNRFFNTVVPLALVLGLLTTGDWKRIWPLFGTTNQLLAALTLVAASIWLKSQGRRYLFTALPAAFMVATTLASLVQLSSKHWNSNDFLLLGTDALLASLALMLLGLAARRGFPQKV